MDFTVTAVEKGSIAHQCHIVKGDKLIKANGKILEDIIDYEYFMSMEDLLLELIDTKGEKYEAEIYKESFEDLGLTFKNTGLTKKACCNKCIFCFVDQLPKGMRKGLYFKDDDWRLSFLMGNYVTLTNLSTQEIFRITEQNISPLYISLHATEKSVNSLMLGRENNAFEVIKTFASHNIKMHLQIVLCEGINDGLVLHKTIEDLYAYNSSIKSVAVVPVGLTAHREGLYALQGVSENCAKETINWVHTFQQKALAQIHTRFVFCADELYLKGDVLLPDYQSYEDFEQIENGVGLMAKFAHEVKEGLLDFSSSKYKSVGIVTGADAYTFMQGIADKIAESLKVKINVYKIENEFFGKSVTVCGLLTGRDIINNLKGKVFDDVLLISSDCFTQNEDVMLDNTTLTDLKTALNVEVKRVFGDGYELLNSIGGDS